MAKFNKIQNEKITYVIIIAVLEYLWCATSVTFKTTDLKQSSVLFCLSKLEDEFLIS